MSEVQSQRTKPAAVSHCREPLTSVGCHHCLLTKCLTCGFTEKFPELYVVCQAKKCRKETERLCEGNSPRNPVISYLVVIMSISLFCGYV